MLCPIAVPTDSGSVGLHRFSSCGSRKRRGAPRMACPEIPGTTPRHSRLRPPGTYSSFLALATSTSAPPPPGISEGRTDFARCLSTWVSASGIVARYWAARYQRTGLVRNCVPFRIWFVSEQWCHTPHQDPQHRRRRHQIRPSSAHDKTNFRTTLARDIRRSRQRFPGAVWS